jgi:hypothetical protein
LFSLFILKETKGLTEAEVAKLYSRETKDKEYETLDSADKQNWIRETLLDQQIQDNSFKNQISQK